MISDTTFPSATASADTQPSLPPVLYDRYPGPRSFADNQVDRRLFFGREQEKEELLHRVRASRLLVLFGKSGLGKTSLLQAGLYPRLREHTLLPVPVRFNGPGADPVSVVLEAVGETCRAQGIEFDPPETVGLWEVFKTTDFWKGEVLWTPVLVLDQFEEIFTLQSDEVRMTLATALGELASSGFPTRIRQRLHRGQRAPYTDTPPEVKVILSLREEYVGALEQLVPNVPTIFERRFRLGPLTREIACQAVVKPATVDDPAVFTTRPFSYKDTTLNAIMEFLVNRQGEVEPFQLQIVCQYVERQVEHRQRQGQGKVEVDETVLGGRAVIEGLLQDFYRRAVRELPSGLQRWRASRLCERGLLSPTGHRVSMEEGQIWKQYKMRESSLKTLTEARLLRKETRPGLEGFYYELSHDSLTGPVMKSRRFWDKLIKHSLIVSATLNMIPLVIAAVAAIWLWQQGYTMIDQAGIKVSSIFVSIHKEPGEMVSVQGGTFRQGDLHHKGDPTEQPVREVSIKRFAMAKYEVTFEEYDRFAIATGRHLPEDLGWGRASRPVINVSWQDARGYAEWLSQATGKRYRLPTEAEWEYAARGGTNTAYWWGNEIGTNKANCDGCGSEWDGMKTAPVSSFLPNNLGLHNTAGNVWEWVQDCWHNNYSGAPTDGSAWFEASGGDCGRRVVRGGSWAGKPGSLRTSDRHRAEVDKRGSDLGFRLAQDIEP